MRCKLLRYQKQNVLIFCFLSIALAFVGCKKNKPRESVEDVPVTKMVKKPLKITNTGAIDIKILRVNYNYDANSCTIKDLKSGQMVRREITVSYPTTLEFVIEYANGEIVKHPRQEGFMAQDKELQIVVEDNGKMYFR